MAREVLFLRTTVPFIGGRFRNDFTNGSRTGTLHTEKAAPENTQVIVDYYGNKACGWRTHCLYWQRYIPLWQHPSNVNNNLQMQEGGSGEVLQGEFSFSREP